MVLQLQSSIRIALHNLYYYILHKYNFILAQQHWQFVPLKLASFQIPGYLESNNYVDWFQPLWRWCCGYFSLASKCIRPRQMTLIIPRVSYMPHSTCACACSMFGCLHCVHAPILLVAVGCIQNCHLVICLPHNLPKDACLLALLACSSYLIVCLT